MSIRKRVESRPYVDILLVATGLFWATMTIHARDFNEDSAMLLRYCGNMVHGAGIVWNVGGPPVDGATDFLYLINISLLSQLGIQLENAAKIVGILAWLAMLWLIFDSMVRWLKVEALFALLISLFVCVGPGTKYIEAGFGATYFAFWCMTLVWLILPAFIRQIYARVLVSLWVWYGSA